MTTLREAAELALKAIEQGETFGYMENVVAPTLEAALKATEPETRKPKPAPFFTWHDLPENNNAP